MSYNVLLREVSSHFAPSKKPKSNPTSSQVKIDALKKKINTYSLTPHQREDLTYRLGHNGKPKAPPKKPTVEKVAAQAKKNGVKKVAAQATKVVFRPAQPPAAASKKTTISTRVAAFERHMLRGGVTVHDSANLTKRIETLQKEVKRLPEGPQRKDLERRLAVQSQVIQKWKK